MTILEWTFFGGLAATLGLSIGSFLNVVAYRVPLGLSVVSPPSACPGCGTQIRARDNIPILSWVLLRGKCRECAEPISVRYLVLEAITGVMFLIVIGHFVPALAGSPDTASIVAGAVALIAFLYFAAVSVALAAIDIDVHRLPDRIVLPSYAAAVPLAVAGLIQGDLVAIWRMLAAAGILVAFYLVLALLKPGGMGLGDVKLAGVIGLFLGYLGWAQLAVGVGAAFLLGGVFGIVLMLTKRAGRMTAVAFGPWMLAGAWIGIFFAEAIAAAYLQAVGLA